MHGFNDSSSHILWEIDMKARNNTRRLTLSDVVTTVCRLARNEQEAAAVINHLLSSSKISFTHPMRVDMRQLLA